MIEWLKDAFLGNSPKKAKVLHVIKPKDKVCYGIKTVVEFENGERKTLNGNKGRPGDKIIVNEREI